MKDEIKEIFCKLRSNDYYEKEYQKSVYYERDLKKLEDYITNLQEENKRLKEQNNDLRKIYRNTYQRLFDNGNDELARYFQAQIDDCPTFYVEPIIDYHKEWKDYKSRNEKAIEYIKEHQRKDEFLNLNEWQTRDLLNILQGEDKE